MVNAVQSSWSNSRTALSILAALLISPSAALPQSQSPSLPDWSGVWQRFEGNGGIFDPSTVEPKDGRAGSPGVRQYPPLTDVWEDKLGGGLQRCVTACGGADRWN